MAVSVFAVVAGDIACVHVVEAGFHAYLSGEMQGLHRCGWAVGESIGWMKAAYMPGDFRIEFDQKPCQTPQLFRTVVETGDQECCDLNPDASFLHRLDRLEDRFQMCSALLGIEPVAKGFEIDIGGVQIWGDSFESLLRHVAVADKDIPNALFVGLPGNIQSVLHEDSGFGIGVRYGAATGFSCLGHHLLRSDPLPQNGAVFSGSLRNVGILAKQAAEIAPHCGNRIAPGGGKEMEKRLLFNGIDVLCNKPLVNKR
jgi:hypothetical protein